MKLARLHFVHAKLNLQGWHGVCVWMGRRLLIMSEYLLLLLSTALVNNVVLVKFLGLCPFMGISKKMDTALSMGPQPL
jgi:hypothetical protein